MCDIFIDNAKERFDYKNHLNECDLFLCYNFPTYKNNFPSDHFKKNVEAYPFIT